MGRTEKKLLRSFKTFGRTEGTDIQNKELNSKKSDNRLRCRLSVVNYVSIGGNITLTIKESVVKSMSLNRHVPESEPIDVESITK